MASYRGSRTHRKTNASIRAFYAKGKLMATQGVPTSLKLTMLGVAAGSGGWRLRWEKLRRKVPKQMKGTSSIGRIKEIQE